MESLTNVIIFLIGLGLNVLLILAFLSLKGKFSRQKKWLSVVSLLSVILFCFIPKIGYRIDKEFGSYTFGFPADGIEYHGNWILTIASLGLIFNFFFFYWIFKFLFKLWGKTFRKIDLN